MFHAKHSVGLIRARNITYNQLMEQIEEVFHCQSDVVLALRHFYVQNLGKNIAWVLKQPLHAVLDCCLQHVHLRDGRFFFFVDSKQF